MRHSAAAPAATPIDRNVSTKPAISGVSGTNLRGLDVLKIAGASISGWYPSYKSPLGGFARQPFTTSVECALAQHLEYHPRVAWFQRGDASPDFVRAHRLAIKWPVPFAVPYVYDGEPHEYWPNWVGELTDGSPFIAEAGFKQYKLEGDELAKADVARCLTHVDGGAFWIGTEETLGGKRAWNLVYLHARRRPFPIFDDIAPALAELWTPGQALSVTDILSLLRGRWADDEIQAAAWWYAAEAAARGHLLVDLDAAMLDLATPLAFLASDDPPLLPDPLPETLLTDVDAPRRSSIRVEGRADGGKDIGAPGDEADADSVVDDMELEPTTREAFLRNLAAVHAVLGGASIRSAARQHEMAYERLRVLVQRFQVHGQLALVPRRLYVCTVRRQTQMRAEFAQLIRELYMGADRPKARKILEHPKLRQLARRLTKEEGHTVTLPSYWQVYGLIRKLDQNRTVQIARSGEKHPQRGRMDSRSYVLSIPAPGLVCQVDEHEIDVHITLPDGKTVVPHKVAGAVLSCVKTGAPLGAVVSLKKLTEEDYMQLLKQAMEPKDALVKLHGCENPWPCTAKPAIILSDRGKIFTSERATQVVVDRLGIVEQIAPSYCPSIKGTVEAAFKWVVERLEHRLPGTTLSNPQDRGRYDTDAEAAKHGITLDLLEQYWIRAWVDVYLQDWDDLRGHVRATLWHDAVTAFGVPAWIGSSDELKLLLMKAVNRKNRAGRYLVHPGKGVNFRGRWYFERDTLGHLYGKEIEIRYSRRDMRVIYIYHEGVYVGDAYWLGAPDGRRISEWEWQALQRAEQDEREAAKARSREAGARIYADAHQGRAAHRREALRMERQRALDKQTTDIHPQEALVLLETMEQRARETQRKSAELAAAAAAAAAPARPSVLPPPVPRPPSGPIRQPVIRKQTDDETVNSGRSGDSGDSRGV